MKTRTPYVQLTDAPSNATKQQGIPSKYAQAGMWKTEPKSNEQMARERGPQPQTFNSSHGEGCDCKGCCEPEDGCCIGCCL